MPNRDNSNGQQPYHLSSASTNDNSQHFTTVHHFSPPFGLFRADLKTLRRQQAAAAARSSIIVRSAGIGLPRTEPVNQRQEICTVPSHEVIYDVPFDAQREEEEDEDSF
ncbi:hypothetical protein niasHT_005011 [Heterodera trifolii]|uniref:Uncharacterized protein n=1 Tax=Heterodera trifolii TaxID=157864 RepID=A0ABD2M0A7_9BILA